MCDSSHMAVVCLREFCGPRTKQLHSDNRKVCVENVSKQLEYVGYFQMLQLSCITYLFKEYVYLSTRGGETDFEFQMPTFIGVVK